MQVNIGVKTLSCNLQVLLYERVLNVYVVETNFLNYQAEEINVIRHLDDTVLIKTVQRQHHRAKYKKRCSDTGTRTLVSCVKGKYANHLHHIGILLLLIQCPTFLYKNKINESNNFKIRIQLYGKQLLTNLS